MHKFQDYDSAFQTAICEGRHFIKFEKHLHDHTKKCMDQSRGMISHVYVC